MTPEPSNQDRDTGITMQLNLSLTAHLRRLKLSVKPIIATRNVMMLSRKKKKE